jgi:hypothetical protein
MFVPALFDGKKRTNPSMWRGGPLFPLLRSFCPKKAMQDRSFTGTNGHSPAEEQNTIHRSLDWQTGNPFYSSLLHSSLPIPYSSFLIPFPERTKQ